MFERSLQQLEEQGLRRCLRTVDSPQSARLNIDGRNVLNLCSNNYLGLADDIRLARAAADCLARYGVGSGASRLVCGNMASHIRLEEALAQAKGVERCLLFSTGYMANVGILPALCGPRDLILADRLNHASIIDGIVLSRARFRRYPHRDMDALERLLRKAGGFESRLIVTDSVFSMDGDIAPLDKIVELARRYDARVMVDEAHAFGVMGERGMGLAEHFGLQGKIDIQMGTLSKAAGCFGAYCCGSAGLIDFLLNRARSFVYTTGLPPSIAAAALKALEIIHGEPRRRQQLWENTRFLSDGLKACGFNTLDSRAPIIPVVIGQPRTAVEFSKRLFDCGVFVQAIRPPTVPVGTARLRVTVMATHRREDLAFALEQFRLIGKELCLI